MKNKKKEPLGQIIFRGCSLVIMWISFIAVITYIIARDLLHSFRYWSEDHPQAASTIILYAATAVLWLFSWILGISPWSSTEMTFGYVWFVLTFFLTAIAVFATLWWLLQGIIILIAMAIDAHMRRRKA